MNPRSERGVTMLVVLVLLLVMLLGGMALAKLTEVGTLASGNSAFRAAALQTSEVGLNTVYQRVRDDITNEDANLGNWYFATMQAADGDGMPLVNFDAAPTVVVGNYTNAYVAERLCEGAMPVSNSRRQCLVRQIPQLESADASRERLDPPVAKQFRLTVRVTGPRNTRTWVQSLITRG